MTGKFVMIVGPTGSGKGTLLAYVREVMPWVVFPVSCTTRPPRPGEQQGVTYHFLTEDVFQQKALNGEFLEWVYTDGRRYGTLKSEILPALEAGQMVIREVDIKGVEKIRKLLPPENVRTVFIDAGEWENLSARILARAPLDEIEMESRHRRFTEEIAFKDQADAVVANPEGKVEEAKKELVRVLQEFARG